MTTRIKDVAAHAGVSIATVSYVLNETIRKPISRETAIKVRAAAKSLNYIPNSDAQRLARRRVLRTANVKDQAQ
jgi:LacI family transcriptional regulator